MTLPTYAFRHAHAARPEEPKYFCDLLIASGRFWRDERSHVRFQVGDGDYDRIDSKHTLREILLSGEILRLEGDLDAPAFDCLWLWFTARRWTFPRLNPERPWNPDKPLPLRHVGQTRRPR